MRRGRPGSFLLPLDLLAALLIAAAALPGCYVVNVAVPLDASGMRHPADWAAAAFSDQVEKSGEHVTGLPAALAEHFRECQRNLTHDPRRP